MKKSDDLIFILNFKEKIEVDGDVPKNVVYDKELQIWFDLNTKKPLVQTFTRQKSSDFGETLMTETAEGVDQSEIISASSFGETAISSTRESADQPERISTNSQISASEFGETIMTKSNEGIDQRETISQCY